MFSVAVFKRGVKIIVILFFILVLLLVVFYFWAGSSTLPEEKLAEIIVFSDKTAISPVKQEVFTVMSYNIGYLSGMTNNLPMKPGKPLFEKNMETFLQLVKEVQPDFIGFQEIDFHSRRSHYINQLRTIAEKSDYTCAAKAINWDKRYVPFPYWPPSIHFGRMLSGQAVLSRRPILSAKRIVLQKPKNQPFYYNTFYLDRLVQVVTVKIDSKDLIILNVHLEAFEQETRETQAKRVLNIYRSLKDDYPVLLMGDFNCVPPDAARKKNFLDEPGTDFSNDKTIEVFFKEKSLSRASPAFTYPADKPNRKLDYIFYNHDKIKLIHAFVPKINSSDHLPVVMQFALMSH